MYYQHISLLLLEVLSYINGLNYKEKTFRGSNRYLGASFLGFCLIYKHASIFGQYMFEKDDLHNICMG